MNWKHFLKPDWRKIILFVVVSISFFVLIATNLLDCFATGGIPACGYKNFLLNFLLLPFNLLGFLDFYIFELPLDFIFLFDILSTLLYWYLLSYLIVWIYDKFRKRK
ncbi:hypothetical protein A3K64_02335 [Candidatus Micrarchaeota archaeon RBG_16_36_9]|nr:MAG: hypothetical protein A3K64_02335 [Candidatus Micrarchaeota archaeon RBG_16_36_9]